MSRAILVMNMPTVCDECDLMGFDNETDEPVCCGANGMIQRYEKPEWCPLQTIPDEEDIINAFEKHCYPIRYDVASIEQGMTITGIRQMLQELFKGGERR